jgi:LPS-assembly lipoprotein
MPRPFLIPTWPALALSVLVATTLGGCGFTPLYATPGMTPALASIDVVAPLNDSGATSREGYFLRLKLNDQLGHDPETASRYRLVTTLKQSRLAQGARVNNIASRYELDVTVSYVLSDNVTGEVLTKGSVPVKVSYDSSDPPYASVAANQDAETRAAEQAAIYVRLALSHYFQTQAEGKDSTDVKDK